MLRIQRLRFHRFLASSNRDCIRRKLHVTEVVQQTLCYVHTLTGMPWWATMASSTVILRISLFPLLRMQILAFQKLQSASTDLNGLNHLFKTRVETIRSTERSLFLSAEGRRQFLESTASYFSGLQACRILHEIPVTQMIAPPFVNIGIFATFTYSMRRMVDAFPSLGLETGGMLWFTNLNMPDPTFTLPIVAIILTSTSVHYSLKKSAREVLMIRYFRNLMHVGLLASIPIVIQFPAGIFCYWIPSTITRIMQQNLLENERFRTLMVLPRLQKKLDLKERVAMMEEHRKKRNSTTPKP